MVVKTLENSVAITSDDIELSVDKVQIAFGCVLVAHDSIEMSLDIILLSL